MEACLEQKLSGAAGPVADLADEQQRPVGGQLVHAAGQVRLGEAHCAGDVAVSVFGRLAYVQQDR